MPVYQFRCDKHGEHDVFKHSSSNLEADICPICGKTSKRVFYMPNHFWQGMMDPCYDWKLAERRHKNNSRLLSKDDADRIEIEAKSRK